MLEGEVPQAVEVLGESISPADRQPSRCTNCDEYRGALPIAGRGSIRRESSSTKKHEISVS